nr:PREDICTED: overexpressed in colon carcinoma 1 protein [Lepisosteus oculatus]
MLPLCPVAVPQPPYSSSLLARWILGLVQLSTEHSLTICLHQLAAARSQILSAFDRTEESTSDDEKRRNYGGVYVGLPVDMTAIAGSQSKSTQKD